MTSMVETLQQQLGPDTIQQISSAIGADPTATSNAVAMALPAIVGGLAQNASTPHGAAALDQALDAHDGGILDNLGGLLGGGAASSIGGAILGHVFGPKRGSVEQSVGGATGLNAQQVGQVLMMLAPIVMGVLGRMKKQSGVDASNLPDVLQQNATRMQQNVPGGLGGMFDANKDGKVGDDLLRAGESMLGNMFGRK